MTWRAREYKARLGLSITGFIDMGEFSQVDFSLF
jgi:hypothetical protein